MGIRGKGCKASHRILHRLCHIGEKRRVFHVNNHNYMRIYCRYLPKYNSGGPEWCVILAEQLMCSELVRKKMLNIESFLQHLLKIVLRKTSDIVHWFRSDMLACLERQRNEVLCGSSIWSMCFLLSLPAYLLTTNRGSQLHQKTPPASDRPLPPYVSVTARSRWRRNGELFRLFPESGNNVSLAA